MVPKALTVAVMAVLISSFFHIARYGDDGAACSPDLGRCHFQRFTGSRSGGHFGAFHCK